MTADMAPALLFAAAVLVVLARPVTAGTTSRYLHRYQPGRHRAAVPARGDAVVPEHVGADDAFADLVRNWNEVRVTLRPSKSATYVYGTGHVTVHSGQSTKDGAR